MASATSSENYDFLNKQIQQVAVDCHQLPERYIRREDEEYGSHSHTNAGDSSSTIKRAEIPVIDVSLLNSSPLELDKLKSAVASCGCFQAINHGIEGSFLEKVREVGRLFFKSSVEEKKKCLRADDDVEGYGSDMVYSDQQTIDWNDRIYLTVLPKHQQRLQVWPQNPSHFREVLDEYSSKIELISEVVLKSMARSLNLEENCFLNQYGTKSSMSARFNYYPPCRWPNKVLGLKPHADGTAITVLLQDKEVEGLQILKDDQWLGVPILRDALTINVGDQMQMMSNGIFKSPVHRVLINSENERMTVAMFCRPHTEKIIGPVAELISDETPRLYKNVAFTLDFFFKNYQQGRRAIDSCKI